MEEETSKSKLPLPEAFVDFLESNGLNTSIYSATDAIPRYIRLKPGCEAEIEEFKAEMECKIEKVDWLPGFYSLPHDIHIANSKAYREDIWNRCSFWSCCFSFEHSGDHVLDSLKLLTNGFRLLKAGGLLIYSTCSLTVAQNEDVVEQFLNENPSAELQEIDALKSWPCRSGRIPKTVRFDPLTSQTSGLFVAKFTKLVI